MKERESKTINKILLFIVAVLVIVIILLLLRGCSKKDTGTDSKGNINVFELKCEIDCNCPKCKNDDKDKENNKNNNSNEKSNPKDNSKNSKDNSKNSKDNSKNSKDNSKPASKEIDDEPQEEVNIRVFDQNKTWNENTSLKLFEDSAYVVKGKIAPESSGTYQFVIKNSTSFNVKYSIEFEEKNNYNINMKYKLKKNNEYVISDWVDYSTLKQKSIKLNSKSSDTYYLEWKWFEGSSDNSIGSNPSSKYGLSIDIRAVQVND